MSQGFVAMHPNMYDEILRRSRTSSIDSIMGLSVITSEYIKEDDIYILRDNDVGMEPFPIDVNTLLNQVDVDRLNTFVRNINTPDEERPHYQESHLDLSDLFREL